MTFRTNDSLLRKSHPLHTNSLLRCKAADMMAKENKLSSLFIKSFTTQGKASEKQIYNDLFVFLILTKPVSISANDV